MVFPAYRCPCLDGYKFDTIAAKFNYAARTNQMKAYEEIVAHYEQCLKLYGDTHKGVDWPNAEGAITRYRVMLDVIRNKTAPQSLLDFGCGAAHLKDYMVNGGISTIEYAGLDISSKFIELSRSKFPETTFFCCDVLESAQAVPIHDYVVMNGVFTEKRSLSFHDMWDFFTKTLIAAFGMAREGVAFNVMSKHVDWEREDLFHVPLDQMAEFLTKNVSRNFVIRNDYGMYEYTVYVYR
jgi:SAM-dependent methyltransferase